MSAPWRQELPKTIAVGSVDYVIRSDYRAALDICAALSDPELSDQEKVIVSLDILYEDFEKMPTEHYREALEKCFWFINGGMEEPARKSNKLVDWAKDFPMIVAPINRVAGEDVRGVAYLHWWSFLSMYYEIGDCTFAQIVRIRDMLARGKPLNKEEREWYNRNRHLVEIQQTFTDAENDVMMKWCGK